MIRKPQNNFNTIRCFLVHFLWCRIITSMQALSGSQPRKTFTWQHSIESKIYLKLKQEHSLVLLRATARKHLPGTSRKHSTLMCGRFGTWKTMSSMTFSKTTRASLNRPVSINISPCFIACQLTQLASIKDTSELEQAWAAKIWTSFEPQIIEHKGTSESHHLYKASKTWIELSCSNWNTNGSPSHCVPWLWDRRLNPSSCDNHHTFSWSESLVLLFPLLFQVFDQAWCCDLLHTTVTNHIIQIMGNCVITNAGGLHKIVWFRLTHKCEERLQRSQ